MPQLATKSHSCRLVQPGLLDQIINTDIFRHCIHHYWTFMILFMSCRVYLLFLCRFEKEPSWSSKAVAAKKCPGPFPILDLSSPILGRDILNHRFINLFKVSEDPLVFLTYWNSINLTMARVNTIYCFYRRGSKYYWLFTIATPTSISQSIIQPPGSGRALCGGTATVFKLSIIEYEYPYILLSSLCSILTIIHTVVIIFLICSSSWPSSLASHSVDHSGMLNFLVPQDNT